VVGRPTGTLPTTSMGGMGRWACDLAVRVGDCRVRWVGIEPGTAEPARGWFVAGRMDRLAAKRLHVAAPVGVCRAEWGDLAASVGTLPRGAGLESGISGRSGPTRAATYPPARQGRAPRATRTPPAATPFPTTTPNAPADAVHGRPTRSEIRQSPATDPHPRGKVPTRAARWCSTRPPGAMPRPPIPDEYPNQPATGPGRGPNVKTPDAPMAALDNRRLGPPNYRSP
jgi:hypothetical protein